jgi:(R,R)-butanediol dehydrogenase / meso-butanediol dehydrogenase / diacetyl reductase
MRKEIQHESASFSRGQGSAVRTIDSPGKRPLPGEVLIRNRFVVICGTDLYEYAYGPIFIPVEPHPFTKAQAPQILGHEFGGVVETSGPGVVSVKAGDRVSVQPLIMPRVGDYYAERGLFHLSSELALAGLSWPWGGMAEYATLNEYNVQAIPDAMSDEEAALVEPAAVAVYACDRGDVKAGNSVFITGADPIGPEARKPRSHQKSRQFARE